MVGPLLESLELELIESYWTPDGNFPDHEPNPLLEENRRLIVEKVRETGADLGIAWDGDADRCFFIDGHGEFAAGDFVTALLAESILRKQPGATILYDVRASWAVRDIVTAAGGTALINRVGHAFFKTRMRDEGAAFGGEVSGHYYFHDFYNADSGTLPALLMLENLSIEGKPLAELQKSQPQMLAWLKSYLGTMPPKAYRWVAEMHEIADFVGEDPSGHQLYVGAAHFYEQFARDFETDKQADAALKKFFAKM